MNKWKKRCSRQLVTVTGRKPNFVGRRKTGREFCFEFARQSEKEKKKSKLEAIKSGRI